MEAIFKKSTDGVSQTRAGGEIGMDTENFSVNLESGSA